MNDKAWIAYVGPFRFPWGQAGSRRVFGNAMSLAEAGFDVHVVSGESAQFATDKLLESAGSGNIYHSGAEELLEGTAAALKKTLTYLFRWGARTVRWLDNRPTPPSCVIVYGGLASYAHHVGKWCKARGIPVVADVVEWYDPSQMIGGRFGPFYASANLAMNTLYPRFDGIIAISSLLETHFAPHCPVVRVPPTVSSIRPEIFAPNHGNDGIRLIYAGTPGTKDLLPRIVEAAEISRQSKIDVSMMIAGVTSAQFTSLCKRDSVPEWIDILGKIDQQQVADQLVEADFSVLVRDSLRFTNAGFPTKFAESLAAGVPVIGNLTSDLGRYLHDEVNGVVARSSRVEDIADAFSRAAALPKAKRLAMRQQALTTARQDFSPSAYAVPFQRFIADLGARASIHDAGQGATAP